MSRSRSKLQRKRYYNSRIREEAKAIGLSSAIPFERQAGQLARHHGLKLSATTHVTVRTREALIDCIDGVTKEPTNGIKRWQPYTGSTPPWEDEPATIDPEAKAQQQRLAAILDQLGEAGELEDIETETSFTRTQAAKYLGVTETEFWQLMRNPNLRMDASQCWSRSQLEAFKARMEYCRARKWRVPECLMPWE